MVPCFQSQQSLLSHAAASVCAVLPEGSAAPRTRALPLPWKPPLLRLTGLALSRTALELRWALLLQGPDLALPLMSWTQRTALQCHAYCGQVARLLLPLLGALLALGRKPARLLRPLPLKEASLLPGQSLLGTAQAQEPDLALRGCARVRGPAPWQLGQRCRCAPGPKRERHLAIDCSPRRKLR